jgi:hypothetical protein
MFRLLWNVDELMQGSLIAHINVIKNECHKGACYDEIGLCTFNIRSVLVLDRKKQLEGPL